MRTAKMFFKISTPALRHHADRDARRVGADDGAGAIKLLEAWS